MQMHVAIYIMYVLSMQKACKQVLQVVAIRSNMLLY